MRQVIQAVESARDQGADQALLTRLVKFKREFAGMREFARARVTRRCEQARRVQLAAPAKLFLPAPPHKRGPSTEVQYWASRHDDFSPLTRQPRIHSNNGQGPVTDRELSPQIAKGALQCAE
jgi:hypothetical protein